jgi:NADP-dependent 3-hydroxy acid dehydrogenase YdfG
MRDLAGKVVWAIGAGTGIGAAGAEALASAGATLILSGRRPEPLEEVAGAIRAAGGEAHVEPLDIADGPAVLALGQAIAARFGRLDIMLNSAAINVPNRDWAGYEAKSWNALVDVDIKGALHCIAAALPTMRRQRDGLIVNISSWAGRYDSAIGGVAYTASKRAMMAMTTTINMEDGRNGIRACAICPAEVATPLVDKRAEPPPAWLKALMLQPRDLGETILFVARMPASVCVNEILISPTWNRAYVGDAKPEDIAGD